MQPFSVLATMFEVADTVLIHTEAATPEAAQARVHALFWNDGNTWGVTAVFEGHLAPVRSGKLKVFAFEEFAACFDPLPESAAPKAAEAAEAALWAQGTVGPARPRRFNQEPLRIADVNEVEPIPY